MTVYRHQVSDRPEALVMIAEGCDLIEAERVLRKKFAARLARCWCEESRIEASNAEVPPPAFGFNGNLNEKSPMHAESYPARRPSRKPASSMGAA